MTVNDFKETSCATAQDELEMDVVVQPPPPDSENLLGRVLAGKHFFFAKIFWVFF